ncbi:MAG: NFACT RNA binding domain-containing protein [Candidatus Melainabacteria bacterium]|nr:NFACT RNA binding domain-containing protein [Candidatus Melainabacteria bacterium]
MQPFDALSLKAVLQEAKPLLLNKRVDKISQLGRDEILIGLRSKSGNINIFLSAHSTYARICLVRIPSSGDKSNSNERNIFERYQIKEKFKSQPKFGVILRKLLYAATLVGVEQLPGERVIDFVFSCIDEVGTTSLKVLSAELMGRHSNLIFWDKETRLILCASHVVTKEMSRRREILPKGIYERPPAVDKPNIFLLDKSVIDEKVDALAQSIANASESTTAPHAVTFEQWLLSSFSGLGKTLAEELVRSLNLPAKIEKFDSNSLSDAVWQKIEALQNMQNFHPHMCKNYSTYSCLGWNKSEDFVEFSACNDMIEHYYRVLESKEQFSQLKERLLFEVRGERQKLEARRALAGEHALNEEELSNYKTTGDLILAHLQELKPGQEELLVDETKIKINPLLTGVQNAQHYYRLYSKARARISSASTVLDEINSRLSFLDKIDHAIKEAPGLSELIAVKEALLPKNNSQQRQHQQSSKSGDRNHHKNERSNNKNSGKRRLLSLNSKDGWKIYAGRNRHENSHLLTIANQFDIWLHVLGQSGAHVLIRVPSTKQDPPKSTLQEAAQIAARLSRVPAGAKVTVVYTQCRYVKSLDKNKIGQVRYENEKTLLVDTSVAMPDLIKRLYSQN